MIATTVICSLIILGCFAACAIGVSKAMQTVDTANARLDKRKAELDRRDELLKAAQIRMTREHAEFGQQALDLNLRLSVCDGQRREALRQLRELQTAATTETTEQAWEIARLRYYIEALERLLTPEERQTAVDEASIALSLHNPPEWVQKDSRHSVK